MDWMEEERKQGGGRKGNEERGGEEEILFCEKLCKVVNGSYSINIIANDPG